MFKVFYFLFSLLVICKITAQSTYEENTYPYAELSNDFDVLSKAILKNHPGTFLYKAKSDWQKFLNDKKQLIKDNMTETEFLKLVSTVT
jgi:hypothetical protein